MTGVRTMLSDFGNTAQGPLGSKPGGVALGPGGAIYVADTDAGTGANGVLFSVDPITGTRTIVSNFGNAAQGATGTDPFFLAVSATGHILPWIWNTAVSNAAAALNTTMGASSGM